MTFESIDTWWWPFVFILIAGWIATDMWRWLGVLMGNRIDETAEILVFVRAVATALVAGVIAKLILFPTGALAESPMFLRIVAAFLGFVVYLSFGNRVWLGVTTALAIIIWGI